MIRFITRLFSLIIFIIVIIFIIYPYYITYQLNNAVKNNQTTTLSQLIDLPAVKTNYQQTITYQLSDQSENLTRVIGEQSPLSTLIRQGAKSVGHLADVTIDIAWIQQHLNLENGFLNQISHAFFESPTRFVIRVGELGYQPMHIEMQLQNWQWQVTAIYG